MERVTELIYGKGPISVKFFTLHENGEGCACKLEEKETKGEGSISIFLLGKLGHLIDLLI